MTGASVLSQSRSARGEKKSRDVIRHVDPTGHHAGGFSLPRAVRFIAKLTFNASFGRGASKSGSRSQESRMEEESFDCQVAQFLRDQVLPHARSTPKTFMVKVTLMLDRGSIHSATGIEDFGN